MQGHRRNEIDSATLRVRRPRLVQQCLATGISREKATLATCSSDPYSKNRQLQKSPALHRSDQEAPSSPNLRLSSA